MTALTSKVSVVPEARVVRTRIHGRPGWSWTPMTTVWLPVAAAGSVVVTAVAGVPIEPLESGASWTENDVESVVPGRGRP
jgi:hypothetical protein